MPECSTSVSRRCDERPIFVFVIHDTNRNEMSASGASNTAGYPKHGPTSRCFNAPKHVCKALNPSSKCGPAAVTYWCKHKTFIIRDSESNRLYRSYFAQLVSDGESIVSVQLLDDDVLKITCLERNAFGSRAKVGIERLGGHSNISEQRKWQHTQPQPQRQHARVDTCEQPYDVSTLPYRLNARIL